MKILDRYLIFDDPVPYKKLLFYPVKIRDYMDFLYLASCLMFEKNSIKDPIMAIKAISMSYLEYLFSISNLKSPDPNENFILLLDALLRLVLNKKDIKIDYLTDNNGKPIIVIDDEIYDGQDFKEIRELISQQNLMPLPDELTQKEVREAIEKAREWKEKRNKTKTASFEEQLLAISLYSGWELDKIYNMTVRKFIMAVQRANHMIMSNIYLTASMSGFVEFKDKSILKGWLADLNEENKYSDVVISLDSVNGTVSGKDAKIEKK